MSYNYDLLWQPIEINKVTLRNRISLSPMGTHTITPVNTDSEEGIRYYEERAKGGVGLIHTGAMFLSPMLAQGSPTYDVAGLDAINTGTQLTERVHRWGAKIFLQVSPGTGRNSRVDEGHPEQLISASPNPSFSRPDVLCREMTIDEIKETMELFKRAGIYAQRAGFDGIQIHGHAGYLIDQFLSECWNWRKDAYGGSFENRCRFILEAVDSIRSVVGKDFPITFRFAVDHMIPGGRTMEEGLKILDVLDKSGIDAFDLDSGCYEVQDYVFPTRYNGEACMAYVCKEARKHVHTPIINAGSHSMETAVELLESGNADIIQFGRQSIADPEFANKLKEGRREDVRPCILCNEECIGRIWGRRTSLSCTVNPAAGFEPHMEITPVSKPHNVVVIGAGPGGMEAARTAALRGCSVTIYDKGDQLGGTFRTIATGDFKKRMRDLVEWYEVQLNKLGVKFVPNTEITLDDPILESADEIFVALGSKAVTPNIPGIDNPKVVGVIDVHKNGLPEGKNVVICGGGLSACDTAIEYGQEGRDITIVEMRPEIGADVMFINAITIKRRFEEYGIHEMVNTKVVGITDEGVEVETADGERKVVPADVIVSAFGQGRNMELAKAIQWKYPKITTVIGDCNKPSKAGNAIREGFYAAMSLQ